MVRHFSRFLALFAVVSLALAGPGRVRAGSSADSSKGGVYPVFTQDDAFAKGTLDLQITSGVLFSAQKTSARRPNFDYAVGVVRVGYMLDHPSGRGLLYGNDEFLLEAMGGGVFVGPGNGLGGLSIMYRRNFLGWQRVVVPFVDLGVGGVYSDAYQTRPQHVLGAPGEFDLQGGLGLRFRLGRRWSVDAEADFRHLSNAGLASRNYGVNSIGGLVGISRAF